MPRFQTVELHNILDDAPRPIAALARSYADGARTTVHRHGRGQLLHAVSGIMRIETADAAWLVPPARALWMPPRMAHRVTMRSRVEMRTLFINREVATALPRSPTLVEVSGLARLSAGESVSIAANAVGYESPSAFSAMVRRSLGAAPRRLVRATP